MKKRWVGCEVETEFFGEERKSSKQERKRKTDKDRSKYKKTDKDKWLKSVEEQKNKTPTDPSHLRGRVLSITPQDMTVDVDGIRYLCHVRGMLKKNIIQEKNLVTVGDFVILKPMSKEEGTIISVEPRRSILARADNLSRRKQQLIAANIDQVLITMSTILPPLKPFLTDRYIIAAEKGGMQPIIILNKIDLLNEQDYEEEYALVQEFIKGYRTLEIPVIQTSIETGQGIQELKKIMKDKASVFSGQSGVGKSSLINAVTGLNLRVRETVEKTQKGSHTTTTAELIPLEFGGFCIDTPGIRSFGVWDLERSEIEAFFDEIHSIGAACQFPDCNHLHELNCAVKKAVEEGTLSPLRYSSYITLLETVNEDHLRR